MVNLIWRLVRSNRQLGETRAQQGFFDCVVELVVPCGVKLLGDRNGLFEPTHEPLWRRIVVFCTVEDGLYCYVL